MQIKKTMVKIINWLKTAVLAVLNWAIGTGQKFGRWLKSLHLGERVRNSRLVTYLCSEEFRIQARKALGTVLHWMKTALLAVLNGIIRTGYIISEWVRSLQLKDRVAQSKLAAVVSSEEFQGKSRNVLSAVWDWIKKLCLVILAVIVMLGRKIRKLLEPLRLGERLENSRLGALLNRKVAGIPVKRILCIVLCIAVIAGLLFIGKDDAPMSFIRKDCSACTGGNCRHCGGSGKESNWVAGTREYLIQDCRFCLGSGNCSDCNGRGYEIR